nr:hypothetical protein [Tanacetum cinerariifolium]
MEILPELTIYSSAVDGKNLDKMIEYGDACISVGYSTKSRAYKQNTTPSTSTTVATDTPPLNTQTTPKSTSQTPTVTATKNINQTETNKEITQDNEDEFINIFSTLVHEKGKTSRYVDSSNLHTFYQRIPSKHHWTKDHPLEQVLGNPSQSVRTRR